jgi:hypothetical protein
MFCCVVAVAVATATATTTATAQTAAPGGTPLYRYADADIALGERLLREHDCAACHVRRVGGDGSAIYRPKGRINTPAALQSMVEYCSVELKLSLFPEEATAIAAVLQRDHYRFAAAGR